MGPLDLPEVIPPGGGAILAEPRWPQEPASLRPAWEAYFRTMADLAGRLLSIMAVGLELPADHFEELLDHHSSAMRAINYPELESRPLSEQLRAGAHTDYGTLSILLLRGSARRPGGDGARRLGGGAGDPGRIRRQPGRHDGPLDERPLGLHTAPRRPALPPADAEPSPPGARASCSSTTWPGTPRCAACRPAWRPASHPATNPSWPAPTCSASSPAPWWATTRTPLTAGRRFQSSAAASRARAWRARGSSIIWPSKADGSGARALGLLVEVEHAPRPVHLLRPRALKTPFAHGTCAGWMQSLPL